MSALGLRPESKCNITRSKRERERELNKTTVMSSVKARQRQNATEARQDEDKACLGKDITRQSRDKTRQSKKARQGKIRQNRTRQYTTRQDKTRRQDKTEPDKTGQPRTRQDKGENKYRL
jgi:hypothetical protein